MRTDWILWQNACDRMKSEILKELREHRKTNVLTSYEAVETLICEVHHPEMPSGETQTLNSEIDSLYTPEDLAYNLSVSFTEDQAYLIAKDVYQPLLGLIKTLNDKIEQLTKGVNYEWINDRYSTHG